MDRLTRRSFVVDLGRAALGVAVLGTAATACSGDDGASTGQPGPSDPPATGGAAPTDPTPANSTPEADPLVASWARVDLGFVSAFIVVRSGEAAVVDTGGEGSEAEVEAVLESLGLGWEDVSDVLLTHRHPDHVGSLPAILAAAPDAAAWAGAGDIDAITSPRPVAAVGDGDEVFGLQVLETPGHTPGHLCAYDRAGGVLYAGDAIRSEDGRVIGPAPEFTPDMDTAMASVGALAGLDARVALVGHGAPVESGVADQLRELTSG